MHVPRAMEEEEEEDEVDLRLLAAMAEGKMEHRLSGMRAPMLQFLVKT
jgi:hypothetical protein